MNYREELFRNYRKSHNQFSGLDFSNVEKFYYDYYYTYYKKIFDKFDKSSKILEIGCNMGSMINILHEEGGFSDLTGIDLSIDDLEIAKSRCSNTIKLECADAFTFLQGKEGLYDIIYSKAVFEHIEKSKITELIQLCKKALKINGVLIVEVPNMDWIYASHERYMDFTHEVGFTKESLGQVFRNEIGNVEIYYLDNSIRNAGIRMKIARTIFSWLLYWSEPLIERDCLFSRSIMAVGVNEK